MKSMIVDRRFAWSSPRKNRSICSRAGRGFRLATGTGILLLSLATMFAAEPVSFATPDARLQSIVDEAAAATLKEFDAKKLLTNQFAITLVDLRDAKQPRVGSFRGGIAIYPASV